MKLISQIVLVALFCIADILVFSYVMDKIMISHFPIWLRFASSMIVSSFCIISAVVLIVWFVIKKGWVK